MYQLDAVQVDTPPVMDGLVLEDSAWGTATPATGFVQSTPNEGESASEKTEVRVVFTVDTTRTRRRSLFVIVAEIRP